MSYIPEDFHWDGVLFCLKCEISYLINALMPLPIQKVEELTNKLQVFPVIIEKDLSYKKRLDLEKKLEHLPLKIFWCPTGQNTLYHFQNVAIKMGLEKSLLPYKKETDSFDREKYLLEQNNFEKLFHISDFTTEYGDEHFLHGLNQTLEAQNIFNKSDLLNFIDIVNTNWSNIWAHAFDQKIILSACQISYFSIGKPIDISKDEHVNLMHESTFSEDFHLILPDYLVRGIYCKLVQSNRTNTTKMLNPEAYQQSIFSMAEIIYILTNNWVKLKEIPDIFLIKYDPEIIGQNYEKIEIKNHSSGAGFLITWKLEMATLPLHKFSMFFTLEMVEQLLQKP